MAEILCAECGDRFVFTRRERAHFEAKGFRLPTRCRACRAARRRRRRGEPEPESEPAPAPSAPREPEPPAAEDVPEDGVEVVCGACGALTRVPFAPTDKRPVYCATCFSFR